MLMQIYGKKANIISRYATKKEKDTFDKEALERIITTLPQGYTLSMMEESLYHKCKAEPWSADLVAQFPDYATYQALGIGAVICKDALLVSGASSYARYLDGIEIEIDTRVLFVAQEFYNLARNHLVYKQPVPHLLFLQKKRNLLE